MTKRFLINNITFFIYCFFSFLLELTTVAMTTNTFFISKPWLYLLGLLLTFFIYNFISHTAIKRWFLLVLLILQCIANLGCVILFENTGTVFDFSMLSLLKETADFAGTVSVNYLYIVYIILLTIVYLLCVSVLSKKADKMYSMNKLIAGMFAVIVIASQGAYLINTNKVSEKTFINNLYVDTNDKYALYGASSNFINEMSKMLFFNKYNELSYKEIENYIYENINEKTEYFGVSKDNNLVTILVESFEWFSFISDSNVYPNGANLNDEKLNALYPNLRKFYNMSVIMNNHYSENKTDMSEDEALLGVYPSNEYINYGYSNNKFATSITNSLRLVDETITSSFFHNNKAQFYNRGNVVSSLGYENLYFIDKMEENGVTNYMNNKEETLMNKDSEMFSYMKDYMFPSNKRFNTHITTISMHGNYSYRSNMEEYHKLINSLDINIENDYLKNYMVSVMDFDKAVGIMLDDLENKGLLDNTTIVMFADHNTYMSDLSPYVKDINNYNHSNYTELYRVPLMIYDSNIGHKVINKFTTTYDIVPTVLDLFGINYYTNLYYGNPIFSDNESVLYTKAFDVFITDKLLFSNINNLLYKSNDVTSEYIVNTENKCKDLLKKIYYTNHIFYYDYFNNNSNYSNYITHFNSLNNK